MRDSYTRRARCEPEEKEKKTIWKEAEEEEEEKGSEESTEEIAHIHWVYIGR